jgi:hypothetical protein
MGRYTDWVTGKYASFDDYLSQLIISEERRRRTVFKTQNDLASAGADVGLSETQIETQIDTLFNSFAGEWSLYILTGSSAIVSAISSDTTIGWLNQEYPPDSGVTIRERLINRLSE